ncbi:histidine kinase [Emticicia sp. BO119]|uniref:tetratricopeptide repeat-containing sensor histidine kinase n=1 Tax=Emticicia sp. BO119 TaxID=2757768 RepID=UPI0015F0D839|nr:histidine kinase [Emticicia sp. BO119]MBA4850497.1 hypothetical protein [Emticicia sp. BO119]
MIKYIFCFFLGILAFNQKTVGQTEDSLATVITQLKGQVISFHRDTLLVVTLNEYAKKKIPTDEPSVGLPYAQEAEKIAAKLHWNKGLLMSYQTIANIQNVVNRHYEAIETGLRGLALAETQKDRYYEIVFARSLGNNYDMLDNYTEALPYYEACLKKSENFPAAAFVRGNCFVEYGDAHRFHLKQPLKAKMLIEEGIKIYQAVAPTSLGYAYDYLGQALTDLKEYKKAEEVFKLSRTELEKAKKIYLIPELLFHTARLYLIQQKYGIAKSVAQEGIIYSRKMGTVYGESEAAKILYLARKATNQPKEALLAYERFTLLRDSLTEVNMNRRFAQVQAEYKAQKQNAQINQLKLKEKNQEIAKQKMLAYFLLGLLLVAIVAVLWIIKTNRQLRQKNREISEAMLQGQTIERKRVAADLHDTLGSTMSSLKWTMEAINTQNLLPEEQRVYANLKEMLEGAYNEVRLLSHNLLPEEFEKQGLQEALKGLVRKINNNAKIRFSLDIYEGIGRLDKKTEFELYSICLELVNNILKHAQATEAAIIITKSPHLLTLQINDNGKVKFENTHEGRGLKNVQTRVDVLNGKWEVKNSDGEGLSNMIVIPL